MPIPTTRQELIDTVSLEVSKLDDELQSGGRQLGNLHCIDEWNVKQLLAIRAWWSGALTDWIHAGLNGESPVTPAPGFSWKQTPELNSKIASRAKKKSYTAILSDLRIQQRRVLGAIDDLDDHQLLERGAFDWAGTMPLIRWIAINSARQYQTARQLIRKAKRAANE